MNPLSYLLMPIVFYGLFVVPDFIVEWICWKLDSNKNMKPDCFLYYSFYISIVSFCIFLILETK